jgi:predicted 3-demethylubiquinone-9 3-methyltransferase (glyoxalase superfamily)
LPKTVFGAGCAIKEGALMARKISPFLMFEGQAVICIDSPVKHAFTSTPALSLYAECESDAEFEAAFGQLSEGGTVLMPSDNYGFSRRFGWVNDRYGVSWQLNLQ